MEITTTWKRLVGGAAALISGLALGHQVAADVVNVPAGYLTGEVSWKSTNTYILQGFVYVVDGATLRIEPF
ncbi:MAG: hypothetical protein FJ379_14695, partial [Verrucomicrobia bacterium]|nr:hypothetical protein [Verrucomicrobiota bacterium]